MGPGTPGELGDWVEIEHSSGSVLFHHLSHDPNLSSALCGDLFVPKSGERQRQGNRLFPNSSVAQAG